MSTGKPVRKPADVQRVKNDYLEYIRKEAELEDRNLQINKQYIENGTLPPSVQMLDTRTNAEKLADIEGLKNKIANDLSPIAEPMFARNIVDKVINSRLNINGKLLRYLSQNAPQIAEQLKKKYSIGIAGDANDVDIIVNFIESYFTETQGTMQSVQDYAKSTTNLTNQQSNVLSVNDINAMIMNLQDMIKRLQISGIRIENHSNKQQIYDKINNLITDIEFIKSGLPSQEILNQIVKNSGEIILGDEQYDNDAVELSLLFKVLESMPKPNVVFTQLDILNKIINNKYIDTPQKEKQIKNALNNIINQFSEFTDNDNIAIIQNFKNKWETPSQNDINRNLRQQNQQRQVEQRQQQNAQPVKITNFDEVIMALNQKFGIPQQPNDNKSVSTFSTYQTFDLQRDDRINEAVSKLTDEAFNLIKKTYYYNDNTIQTKEDLRMDLLNEPDYTFGEYGIGGLGIKSTKKVIEKRGRAKDKFIIFGKGVINQTSLDKGILTYKRANKTNYNDLPSKRISSKLKGIINTIVGGGNPNYNDLSNLDENEKEYLYKICKKSNLLDRLTIPAPSKDKEEKDIHEFEVMKGQIMSGNDNKDLVKKFKIHIMKMAKQGLLPRNEVNDILEQLVLLGY